MDETNEAKQPDSQPEGEAKERPEPESLSLSDLKEMHKQGRRFKLKSMSVNGIVFWPKKASDTSEPEK